MSQTSLEQDDGPDRQRQGDRADDRQPREKVDLPDLQASSRIPEEMPHAAEHVMSERPGVAEEHELADRVREDRTDEGELRPPMAVAMSQAASSRVPK